MADKNTSIMQDMAEIKELLNEMRPAPDGRCDDCNYPLLFERGWHGTDDEPPSESGFWCDQCGEFKDD